MPMMDTFKADGCLILRDVLTGADLHGVENLILSEVHKYVPEATGINDRVWVDHAIKHPDTISKMYDAVRDADEALQLGQVASLVDTIKSLMEEPMLYNKVPLRIDVPFVNKELAFWHQDDFYVQGNARELTAWIPLQDTKAHHGALSVMKGSHKGGPIPHTLKVGKKTLPEGIFENPVNIVEMNRGDVLIFSSYLVHSSNLNISDAIRYSIQLRYSDASAGAHSSLMKGVSRV